MTDDEYDDAPVEERVQVLTYERKGRTVRVFEVIDPDEMPTGFYEVTAQLSNGKRSPILIGDFEAEYGDHERPDEPTLHREADRLMDEWVALGKPKTSPLRAPRHQ